MWLQQDLDGIRAAAKKRFRNSQLGNCSSCGKWIKCGYVQTCGDISFGFGAVVAVPGVPCGRARSRTARITSGGGAHDVPWDIKSANRQKFFRPWTVQRQIWTDALKPCHSEVSTDVLLFSEFNLSLAHHYRVFKHGFPHLAFRKDYDAYLRVFVSQATALAQCDMASPVPLGFSTPCESESPRKTRRARRWMRPTVFGTNLSVLSFQP